MAREKEIRRYSINDQITAANWERYNNLDKVDEYLKRPFHALRLSLSIQLLKDEIGTIFPNLQTREVKILELGSSTGKAASELSRAGYDVTASDIAALPVASAREAGVKCVQFDVSQEFPFPDKSICAILMGELIEHIFDTSHLLSECNRVLCDHGIVVITTPNLGALQDRFRLLFGRTPRQINPLHENLKLHIRPFTYSLLEKTLQQMGFVVRHVYSNYVFWEWGERRRAEFRLPARLFPKMGGSLIVSAYKVNDTS